MLLLLLLALMLLLLLLLALMGCVVQEVLLLLLLWGYLSAWLCSLGFAGQMRLLGGMLQQLWMCLQELRQVS